MNINAILARDSSYGIGNKNGLPWPHSSEDMKWFKDQTKNSILLMGRTTWESIGKKKLPGRLNFVVSNQDQPESDGTFSGDLGLILDELEEFYPDRDLFIIGGAKLFEQALPYCDKLYLTVFKQSYECDTFLDPKWIKDFTTLLYSDNHKDLSFTIWKNTL